MDEGKYVCNVCFVRKFRLLTCSDRLTCKSGCPKLAVQIDRLFLNEVLDDLEFFPSLLESGYKETYTCRC